MTLKIKSCRTLSIIETIGKKKHTHFTALKFFFCLCQSIHHCDTGLGGQVTFYGSHKRIVSIQPVCSSKGLSTLGVQKVIRKKIQKRIFLRLTKLFEFALSYFSGFNLFLLTIKLLIWDDCFTVTLTLAGRMSLICPALYQYETIT